MDAIVNCRTISTVVRWVIVAFSTCGFCADAQAQVYCYPVQTYNAYNYAPTYYPPTAAIGAQPQQVSYMPQTVMRQVPVTTYQQVASFDPWTGQQVLTMRPITTMQWQQLDTIHSPYGSSSVTRGPSFTYGWPFSSDSNEASLANKVYEQNVRIQALGDRIDNLQRRLDSQIGPSINSPIINSH